MSSYNFNGLDMLASQNVMNCIRQEEGKSTYIFLVSWYTLLTKFLFA